MSLRGKKLLLVDDEAAIRDMLKDEFLLLGALVDEAAGGNIALTMVKAGDYDAVISDITMPDGDGIGLVIAINRLGLRRPKVFICSGMSPADFPNLETGVVVAFFEKPLDFEKITSVVAASLSD